MWIIEKTIKKGEYLYVIVRDHPKANKFGYVLAHRVIMENKLGRLLSDEEEVHHKNGNKHDNSPDNLEVMLHGEHQRFHNKLLHPNGETKIECICKNCEKVFYRTKSQFAKGKGYKNTFCSRRCNGIYNGYQHVSVMALPSKQKAHNG